MWQYAFSNINSFLICVVSRVINSTSIMRNDLTQIATEFLLNGLFSHVCLYYISKVLKNPSGGKKLKTTKISDIFLCCHPCWKRDFCISACLMSTQMVPYYPQSTRNFNLYETSCWMQYSVCPGLIFPVRFIFYTCLNNKQILAREKICS